jgi:hypothetical protein
MDGHHRAHEGVEVPRRAIPAGTRKGTLWPRVSRPKGAGGKRAARIAEADDVAEDRVALASPDGAVVAVRRHQVGPWPTEIKPHVPVGP